MITRSLRFSGYVFALTTVLAALVDSGAMALGGADVHYAQVGGLVTLALGIGLLRPGPCGHLHLMSASAVGVAAWILPSMPRMVAIPLLLGMTLPLTIVARRFGQVLSPTSTGGRGALLVGFCFGLMLVNFGTGPWLFFLMLVGILLPPPVNLLEAAVPADASASEKPAEEGIAQDGDHKESPSPLQQSAVVMIALTGAAMMLALHPYLTLFDDGSVLQDTRRTVALLALFVLGWWLLGSSIGENKTARWPGATILSGVIAVALGTATTTAGRLSESKIFDGLRGWAPLVNLVGLNKPLTEAHWVWVPMFTVVICALPMIAWSAALRTSFGPRKTGMPTSLAAGLALLGFGIGYLLIGGIDHRFAGEGGLLTAFGLALVTALACSASGPIKLGIPALALAIVLPFTQGGVPTHPVTGNPFRDWFTYQIAKNNNDELGQRVGHGSIARVLDRGGALSKFGAYFLADGRNMLTPPLQTDRLWSAEILLPLVLKGKADRALVVGTPHGPSMLALKETGADAVHWAVDPPELFDVAWGYQPTWYNLDINGVTATAAEADGKFDYVFLRENATWEQRRVRSMRKAAIRHAARKLNDGGMLAVAIDPTRAMPGLVSAIGDAMSDAVGSETRYWVMPHGLRTPGLILTAQKGDDRGANSNWIAPDGIEAVLTAMNDLGYPLQPNVDLGVLEFTPRADESEHFSNLLAGPLPNIHLALASTAFFGKEEMIPFQRAGRVLGGLGSEGDLAWAMATHANAQIYDLPDNQLVDDEKKVDFDFATFQGLLELARLHPESLLLQRTCEIFAWALVENREVEWNMAFTPKLVDDLGWRTPSLLWAYASALTEMLDPEGAEKLVMEALEIDPNHELAGQLLRHITGEENLKLESRAEREGHADH